MSPRGAAGVVVLATSSLAVAFVVGCDGGAARPGAAGAPTVAVVFQGEPLAGVQVSLYDRPGEPPLARAVTGDDGKACFTDVPTPEPERYRVGLESLGDGGWMLDRNVVEPFCEAQRLDPLEQSPSQELALPDRAVRPLDPGITR